jgi:hypothetical protein
MREFPEMVERTQEIIDERWSFWDPVLKANSEEWKETPHAT